MSDTKEITLYSLADLALSTMEDPAAVDGRMSATFAKRPCGCVMTHVPSALATELHHVFPQEIQRKLWGAVPDQELEPLCDTGHKNVHECLRRKLRGEIYRLYNWRLEAVVKRGMVKIEAALLTSLKGGD